MTFIITFLARNGTRFATPVFRQKSEAHPVRN
jgi:hypothetical protein